MPAQILPLRFWSGVFAAALVLPGISARSVGFEALPPDLAAQIEAAHREIAAGRPNEALTILDRAIAAAKERKLIFAHARLLKEAGSACNGLPQRALDYYSRAIPLWRELGNRKEEGYALYVAALLLREKDKSAALNHHRQAIPIHRELGDHHLVADGYLNLGLLYRDRSQPEESIAAYRDAIAAARVAKEPATEAHALRMIGEVLTDVGRYREALERLQQARDLARTVKDGALEAGVLVSISRTQYSLGAPDAALAVAREAEALAVRAKDALMAAQAQSMRARLLLWSGRRDEAYPALRDARASARAAGSKWLEVELLLDLAGLAQSRGATAEALGYLDEAAAIQAESETDAFDLVQLRRGHVLLAAGRFSEAEPPLRAAAARAAKAGVAWCEADALQALSHVQRGQKDLDGAKESRRKAIAILERTGDRGGQARALAELAVLEWDTGNHSQACGLMNRAVRILEQMRESLGGQGEVKASQLRATLALYHRLVYYYFHIRMPAAAFKWAERTKARSLIDLMASGRVDLRGGLAPDERDQEDRARREAAEANRELIGASQGTDAKRIAALKERVRAAETRLHVVTSELYARHPELAERRAARTVEVQELPSFLPADTVLLQYVVMEGQAPLPEADKVLAFCCTSDAGEGSAMRHQVRLSASELRKKVEAFRSACASGAFDYRELARELHRYLIPPEFRGEIEGKKRIVICPDGFLWQVPFQALIRPRTLPESEQYLIEEHEVVYEYSATATRMALARDASAGPALPLSGSDVGVFARSDFGGTLPALPHAIREAEAIAKAFPGAVVFKDAAADEEHARQAAAKFRCLHFATHGLLSEEAPLESGLALARGAGAHDGRLTARELFEIPSKAELIVLSSCRSGDGELRTGDGLVGLAWALAAAGVRTQVLSQWDLADGSASEFMSRFYQSLAAGKGKGTSARAAALAVMKSGKYSHPRYWAPFILLGDWN